MRAKNEKEPQLLLNRRELLKGAAGTAALVSVYPWGETVFAESEKQKPSGRIRDSFDFGWKFHLGDSPGAHEPEFSDSAWSKIDLPHDWSIDGPFDEHAPSGFCGGYLPTGIGWYRKRFSLPAFLTNQVLTIEFDGVYENSEVWINGELLGKRPYGYVPFFYDLTPHVKFDRDNIIAVRVDNSRQTNCRWYSGSGIYRHTWLLSTSRIHVAQWGTFIRSTTISKDKATAKVSTRVENKSSRAASCILTTTLRDSDGKALQTTESTKEVPAGGQYEFPQEIDVSAPQLWSGANPYLYTVHSAISTNGQIVDEYDTPFGIREAVFDADKGFLLNGERVKLKGVCLHHDGGCVGAAVPERIWERRLEILREMGCNAIRTAHNAPAAEFLDLCDRMGFLVLDEAFDEWKVPKGQIGPHGYSNYFDEWYERDVQNLIRRDRNHPSVVLWSAGNEVGDQQSPQGPETLGRLLRVFRSEDPTRPVTVGCDHICSEPKSEAALPAFLTQLDVVGYNYADRWRDRREKYYSIDRHAFPQRRFVGTESESMGGIRGDYRYLFPGDPSSEEMFSHSQRGRNIDVEQLQRFVTTYDYVAGDFMWTGIDHLGEARWPMKGSATGVIDTCGFKKDGFYFYQSQWIDKPVLHMFPHWNWKGREGRTIPVTCYTNCDTVELFLNGRSVGTKGYAFPRPGMELRYGTYPARSKALRTTADLHLCWDVPFEPGTLKAVGVRDEKVVATAEISTTGEPAAIRLTPDRETIVATRSGICHVTVEILDAQGRLVPTANDEITFNVQGAGMLLAADSGDPHSHEDYRSTRRRSFNGLSIAIVQATGALGEIHVSATSRSLHPANVILTANRDYTVGRSAVEAGKGTSFKLCSSQRREGG